MKPSQNKYRVGILGATGLVGQRFITLLKGHPLFEISYLAASQKSAGKNYNDAVMGHWHMNEATPENIGLLRLENAADISKAKGKCDLVFSAMNMEKRCLKKLELEYAQAGLPVISNNSAHRKTPDVPVLIPEINPEHLEILKLQKKNNNDASGFIVVKPNCSVQSYIMPLFALEKSGYKINKIIITTMQSLSGAGYAGPYGLEIIDNIIPYMEGEEEKAEWEPLKIFGRVGKTGIELKDELQISAQCNRVPVLDGHMASVCIGFSGKKPNEKEIKKIWQTFTGEPQILNLPFAPDYPIQYCPDRDRPQPRKDRDRDFGMVVSVGCLRKCSVLDYRFVGLNHNTLRGAAGGTILMAEMLAVKGYFNSQ